MDSIAIGYNAGSTNQGLNSIAIGASAGSSYQGNQSVAIGNSCGQNTQGAFSVAIGYSAGAAAQGDYCVAIGNAAAPNGQHNNTIVLNSKSTALNTTTQSAFYVAPIRGPTTVGTLLEYNTSTGEVTYRAKTFVIDHPIKENHHLIHACLEGPEAGVYYRGETSLKYDRIYDKYITTVELPDYVMSLAKEFTVHVNPVVEFDNDNFDFTQVVASKIKDGKFKIYANNSCKVHWLVFGKRLNIDVEVEKDKVQVKGQGPYRWI